MKCCQYSKDMNFCQFAKIPSTYSIITNMCIREASVGLYNEHAGDIRWFCKFHAPEEDLPPWIRRMTREEIIICQIMEMSE